MSDYQVVNSLGEVVRTDPGPDMSVANDLLGNLIPMLTDIMTMFEQISAVGGSLTAFTDVFASLIPEETAQFNAPVDSTRLSGLIW